MKKNRIIAIALVVTATMVIVTGFTNSKPFCNQLKKADVKKEIPRQQINMFVTHGHCSTPFVGKLDKLTVDLGPHSNDGGNPVENMEIYFEINPNTFNVCSSDDLTERVKTPGLFISEDNENMVFRSNHVYTMGLDWYQVNGEFSIKGVERDVKFFVTGIRTAGKAEPNSMVLEGQFDLMEWGIDYDKIVNGKSDAIPTKWLHLNMRFELS